MINTLIFTEEKLYLGLCSYSRRNPKIKKQISMPYPKKSFANGEILDTTVLAHAVEAKLKKNRMKAQSAIFVINSSEMSVVDFSIPNVKGKITQAVQQVMTSRFTNIQDKYYISYKLRKLEGKRFKGYGVIAPKSLLDDYYELSVKLGMKLQAIDYMGNVLYKSALLVEPKIKKGTGIILDHSLSGLSCYFYSEGGMIYSRGENENSLFATNGLAEEESFEFEEKLEISGEDEAEIEALYVQIPNKLEILKDFHKTIGFFLNRYREKTGNEEKYEVMQEAKDAVLSEVIDLQNMCSVPFEFTPNCEKRGFAYFNNVCGRIQGLSKLYNKLKPASPAFYKEIDGVVEEANKAAAKCAGLFKKYIEEERDPEEYQRGLLLKRVCKLLSSMLMMVDLNGNYNSIDYVYIDGFDLTDKEKKLIGQNISRYYTGSVTDTNELSGAIGERWIGAAYNEYSYFNDLDLASELEKNDKYNRTAIDSLVLGAGIVACMFVVAKTGLAGWNLYEARQLEQQTLKNESYLSENIEVTNLAEEENELEAGLDEVEHFEGYFQASRIDLKKELVEVADVYSQVDVLAISIAEDNMVTVQTETENIGNISKFVEMMLKDGYKDCAYTNVSKQEDGGYMAEIVYKYVPDTATEENGEE